LREVKYELFTGYGSREINIINKHMTPVSRLAVCLCF